VPEYACWRYTTLKIRFIHTSKDIAICSRAESRNVEFPYFFSLSATLAFESGMGKSTLVSRQP
jgi:hypothetical protein